MFLILAAGTVDFMNVILNLPATIALPGSYFDPTISVIPFFVNNGCLKESMSQGIK